METTSTSGSRSASTRARIPKGLRQRLERLLAGAQAMADGAVVPIRGGQLSKEQLVAALAEAVARFEAVDARLVDLNMARKEVLASAAPLVELAAGLKDSLRVVHGRRSPVLAQFGLKPHADRRPLNSEERLVRAEKMRQTRRLRHTMGSRQKASVKFTGTVTVAQKLSAPGAPEPVPIAPVHGPSG